MTEGMNVKDYDYDLPEELIAQDPLEDRSSSRLMVLDRQTGDVEHRHFTDILEYLHPGDCLVINNTKVIPARLFGVKEDTQAKIEVLLLKRYLGDTRKTGEKSKTGHKTCVRRRASDGRSRGCSRRRKPSDSVPL